MRKGQAAMEFLMTYGWAILVVLAAIGALAYFGVLNPGRFLPTKCTISGGLPCTEFEVDGLTAAGWTIVAQNSLGDTAVISAAQVVITQPTLCAGTYNYAGAPLAATLQNGDYATFVKGTAAVGWQAAGGVDCTAAELTGRVKGTITLTYTKSTDQVAHTLAGEFQGFTNN